VNIFIYRHSLYAEVKEQQPESDDAGRLNCRDETMWPRFRSVPISRSSVTVRLNRTFCDIWCNQYTRTRLSDSLDAGNDIDRTETQRGSKKSSVTAVDPHKLACILRFNRLWVIQCSACIG